MNSITRKFTIAARNNTLYALPSLAVLFWLIFVLHEKGWHGKERLCCAVIGWLFGWCMALWGAALLASAYAPSVHDGSEVQ